MVKLRIYQRMIRNRLVAKLRGYGSRRLFGQELRWAMNPRNPLQDPNASPCMFFLFIQKRIGPLAEEL